MNIRYYLIDNSRIMTRSLASEVLRYPHITEKTTLIAQSRYMTFIVDKKFNKCDIKKACEILFETEIEKVNVINQKGRIKAFKGKIYRRASFKKAMVLFKDTEALNEMMRGNQ